MDTKIFLQGFDSKKSSNTSEGLDVQFKGRRKLLPLNDASEVISQYDQYREEREKCNKIRLTCQVNPICSNVLFNRITEIVHNEGSSAVTFINYSLNPSGDSPTGYSPIFDSVIYKPKTMSFWNSGEMKYQSRDTYVFGLQPNKKLSDITDTKHYANGVIESAIHPTNAIRDTQLSKNNIGFIYHCGLDFLNNHLVRSNTFKTVCKCPMTDMGEYTAFNTIADLMRTVDGKKVVEKLYFPISESSLEGKEYLKLLTLHLYEYDDILSYEKTLEERLIPKYNGWVGFYNRPKIKSYSDFAENDSMEIERPLSYLNSGDFVDMYPGRDLYSFVPKYNNFQKRIEKNWNYCITYPSSSYTPSSSTEPFGDIIETNDGLNSLKAIYFDENIRADNGTTQLVIYSIAKHGLSKGDYVNIYKTFASETYWIQDISGNVISRTFYNLNEAEDELEILKHQYSAQTVCGGSKLVEPDEVYSASTSMNNEKVLDNAEVAEIVDDYIFMVFNSNTQISKNWVYLADNEKDGRVPITVDGVSYTMDDRWPYFKNPSKPYKYYVINNSYVNFDDTAQNISYKKTYGDIECDYYIRIFSKLPNFKFASGDTSSEYEIYRQRENGETMLSTYQDKKYDFENHISRLAFAKNIYTDEVGELVFTDDIDISNIHDNLGRPLTSLYLTIIKNNKGYKEWYGYDWNNKMGGEWATNKINTEFENVEFSHCFGPVTCGIKTSDETIYDNSIRNIVRINNIDRLNIGYDVNLINGNKKIEDRCYYSSTNNRIIVEAREIWYDIDNHFYGDLCYYDNYNAIERHIQYVNHRVNTAQRELISEKAKQYFESYVYDEIKTDDYDAGDAYSIETVTREGCTKLPEGYYYNPHYEIPIKTFDKLQTITPDFLTIRQFKQENKTEGLYTFVTLQQHFLSDGDKAMLYDTISDRYYKLIAVSGKTDNYRTFTCRVYDEKTDKLTNITYANSTIEELSTQKPMASIKVQSFKLFKMDNLGVPSYARILKDGTCRIIWRNVLNNGFNKSDDSIEEYPFTNGAFYVNRRIDLFVRRQDPYNNYHLYDATDIEGNITDMTKEDNYIKEADIEC